MFNNKKPPQQSPQPLVSLEKEEESAQRFAKIKSRSNVVQVSTKSQIADTLVRAVDTSRIEPTDLQIPLGTFVPSQYGGFPKIGFQGVDGPKGEMFSDKAHSPLNLVEMHTTLQISVPSNYAKTSVVMTFLNTTGKVLEGELEFPLPDKSTVCGFGLDVDGDIVDATPVEKEKARVIFETEVRKNKDPGLIEHVGGNVFRTRVYPLPANGTRQIKVVFVTELLQNENLDLQHWFPFDSNLEQRKSLQTFSFSAEIVGHEGEAPICILVDNKGDKKQLTKFITDNGKFTTMIASRSAANPSDPISKAQGLLLHIPINKANENTGKVLVELDAQGNYFFVIQDFVAAEMAAQDAQKAKNSIGIIWDASLSRESVDKGAEVEVIRMVLERFSKQGSFTVHVALLRHVLDNPVSFTVSDAKSTQAVVDYLLQVQYDGGTCLAALSSFFQSTQVELALLFTDAFSNVGPESVDTNAIKAPLYAFSNAVKVNSTVLNLIAQKSGGRFQNILNANPKALENAAALVGEQVFSFLYAEVDNDAVLVDIVPTKPTPAHGTFIVAGRIDTPQIAKIELCYGFGNQVVKKVSYVVDPSTAVNTDVLNIFWASRMIEDLSAFPELNKDGLKYLGLTFGLVTPGTSLIVLETLEQHVKYNVEPAASRVQLRNKYQQAMKDKQSVEKKTIDSKLDKVYAKWKDRVNWYNQDFSSRQQKQQFLQNKELSRDAPSLLLMSSCRAGASAPSLSFEMERSAPRTRGSAPPRRCAPVARNDCLQQSALEPNEPEEKERRKRKSKKKSKADSCSDDSDDDDGKATPLQQEPPRISVKQWDPQTPYIQAMKNAGKENQYSIYLEQRKTNRDSPAFFFDCADFFFQTQQKELAVRILTNIAELQMENSQLMRVMAYKMHVEKELLFAMHAFEKVLKQRPEEPQSYRDLALVLDDMKQYKRAMPLLWKVVTGKWDSRFDEIELTALVELNRIVHLIKNNKWTHLESSIPTSDQRFLIPMEFDLRISLAWDTDMIDIDLHVLDPWGEDGFYGNRNTHMGGHLSRDFTQGYGPEEFMIRKARKGKYQIKTHYFASHQQSLSGGTTLLCSVFTNYARDIEEKQIIALRLSQNKDSFLVGEIEWTAN